jgi:hypothetical protein
MLDIFVGAVEEEDSFLYLSAVQGLSALVDVWGKRVVKRLVSDYSKEGEVNGRELDKRLRIGEALVQVVQRAAEALPVLGPSLAA